MQLEKVDLDGNALYEYSELVTRIMGRDRATAWAAVDRADALRSDAPATLYLLRDATGAAAAYGWVRTPLHDHLSDAEVWVGVEPRLRRYGVGAEMLGLLEGEARQAGRTRLTSFTQYREGGDETGVRFAYRHDFEVVQRMGVWFAPVARVAAGTVADDGREPMPDASGDVAAARPSRPDGAGYDIVVVVDTPHEASLTTRARLAERMSREMPQGDADREQTWDEDRVRGGFADNSGNGRHMVEALALQGDEVVGYSDVLTYPGRGLGSQRDTYVAAEHRGHGLGATLKAAVAARLADVAPHVTELRTFVDESNEPMNRVNEALGYEKRSALFDLAKELA